MSGLTVQVEERDPWVVLIVVGEVDVPSVHVLRDAIQDQLAKGSSRLVVDLVGVDYLDSTGLGTLTGGLRRARGNDGDLRIIAISPRMKKLFEVTGLIKAFRLGETFEEVITEQLTIK